MFHAIKCALGFEKPLPEFSREEVAKHNTLDSCWIVAGEKVYDVTYFIDLHPAGRLALVKRGGGCHDCKNDYKFHSKGARDQWKKYQIGVLSSEALASRPPPSAAPSPALLKEVEVPIHFGKEPTAAAQAVKTVSSSPSPSPATAVDDDGTGGELDGGEDCVADGHCCQGTVPGDKCRTCPHAPACMKSGTCKNFPRRKPTSGAADW